MTRADIIQIIFGIETEEMDIIKDLLNERFGNCHNCTGCEYNESESNPLCFTFWVEPVVAKKWEDCVQRFRILHDTYSMGHKRGYLEGVKRQHELESEGKNND